MRILATVLLSALRPKGPNAGPTACLPVALVALLFQGSTPAHMFLVEHTRCAEHGDLVHGEMADATEPAALDSPALRGDRQSEEQAGHAHCSHAAERRDAAPGAAGAESSSQTREIEPNVAQGDAPIRDASDRYRLAPKSSPPA